MVSLSPSWTFMRLHVWDGGRALKGSRSPTSMTNSNPSRFFISSTRYLGIKGEKHV